MLTLAHGCSEPAEPEKQASAGPTDPASANGEVLAVVVATCADVRGTVEVRRRGVPYWEPVALGMTFRDGDWIRSKERSGARLRFLSGGHLDLDERSVILVEAAPPEKGETEATLRVSLASGSAHGELDGTATTRLLVASSEKGVASIVADPGSGPVEFRLSKTSGGVDVAVGSGKLKIEAEGAATNVAAGEVVELGGSGVKKVGKLIDYPESRSPGIDARFQCAQGLEIPLSWVPVPQAAGYRVEIASDMSFNSLVDTFDVVEPITHFAPREPGVFVWRVAARDADKRQGEFGFARRIYCETEVPRDLLIAPRDGARIAYADQRPPVDFSWQSVGDATSYEVVIARGIDLNFNPLVREQTSSQRHVVDSLPDGTYRWGVYAERDGVLSPIFLTPRRMTISKRQAPKVRTDGLWK